MKWFNNLSIRNKLLVGFGLMLACFMAMIVTAYSAISSITEIQATIFQVEFPLTVELVKLRANLNRERVLLTKALHSKSPSKLEEVFKDFEEVDREIDEHTNALQELSKKSPGIKGDLGKFLAIRNEFEQALQTEILPLVREGKSESALEMVLGSQYGRYEKMRDLVFNLSKISEANDKKMMDLSRATVKNSFLVFAVMGAIALIVVVAMSLAMVSYVANPIGRLSGLAEKVAYGDLRVQVPSEPRGDEVGTLQFMFGMMVASLRQITLEIRDVVQLLSAQIAVLSADAQKGPRIAEDSVGDQQARATKLAELSQRLEKLIGEYKL